MALSDPFRYPRGRKLPSRKQRPVPRIRFSAQVPAPGSRPSFRLATSFNAWEMPVYSNGQIPSCRMTFHLKRFRGFSTSLSTYWQPIELASLTILLFLQVTVPVRSTPHEIPTFPPAPLESHSRLQPPHPLRRGGLTAYSTRTCAGFSCLAEQIARKIAQLTSDRRLHLNGSPASIAVPYIQPESAHHL